MGRVNAVSLFRYAPILIGSLRSKIKEVGVFCERSFVFNAGFFCFCVSLRRPHGVSPRPARLAWFPLKPTPMQEGWGFRCFMKGDGQKTHSRAEKKAYENYITKKYQRDSGPDPHS